MFVDACFQSGEVLIILYDENSKTHIYQAAWNFSPTFQVPKIRRSPVEVGSLSAQCLQDLYMTGSCLGLLPSSTVFPCSFVVYCRGNPLFHGPLGFLPG